MIEGSSTVRSAINAGHASSWIWSTSTKPDAFCRPCMARSLIYQACGCQQTEKQEWHKNFLLWNNLSLDLKLSWEFFWQSGNLATTTLDNYSYLYHAPFCLSQSYLHQLYHTSLLTLKSSRLSSATFQLTRSCLERGLQPTLWRKPMSKSLSSLRNYQPVLCTYTFWQDIHAVVTEGCGNTMYPHLFKA